MLISALLDSQTVTDAADWFGVSPSTMQKWCLERRIEDAVGLTIRERMRRIERQRAALERERSIHIKVKTSDEKINLSRDHTFDEAWKRAFNGTDTKYQDQPGIEFTGAIMQISRSIANDRPADGLRSVWV